MVKSLDRTTRSKPVTTVAVHIKTKEKLKMIAFKEKTTMMELVRYMVDLAEDGKINFAQGVDDEQ